MYFCNCIEAHQALAGYQLNAFHKMLSVESRKEQPYRYIQIIPTKNKECPHCGYYALYSDEPLHLMERAKTKSDVRGKPDSVSYTAISLRKRRARERKEKIQELLRGQK